MEYKQILQNNFDGLAKEGGGGSISITVGILYIHPNRPQDQVQIRNTRDASTMNELIITQRIKNYFDLWSYHLHPPPHTEFMPIKIRNLKSCPPE
jgi:hypothetical protein